MKNNLSVICLFLKSTFYKVMGIIVLMLSLESIMFAFNFKSSISLEELAADSFLKLIFMLSGIIIFLLCIVNFSQIAKSYRARLLKVKAKEVYFDEAAAGILIFALWFLFEVFFVLILAFIYENLQDEQFITAQTIFLAFYRSDFLHFLLPLDDLICLAKNVLLVSSMGFAVSFHPERKENIKIPQIITPVFVFFGTIHELGNEWNIISSIVLTVLLAWMVISGMMKEEVYNEDIREN